MKSFHPYVYVFTSLHNSSGGRGHAQFRAIFICWVHYTYYKQDILILKDDYIAPRPEERCYTGRAERRITFNVLPFFFFLRKEICKNRKNKYCITLDPYTLSRKTWPSLTFFKSKGLLAGVKSTFSF